MKKIILPALLILLLMLAVWRGSDFYTSKERVNIISKVEDLNDISIIFKPNNQKLKVALAKSEASRAKGLGGQMTLTNDGMLFVFPRSDRWQFWMKGMQFDLDFVWIQNNRIVGITPKVTAPNPQSKNPNGAVVYSTEPINLVLELPAGRVQELDLRIGDRFEFVVNPK